MQKVQGSERIIITYVGELDNGEIFEEATDSNPIDLTLGSQTLFPALEHSLIGMEPGETRTIKIPAEYAYGPHHKNLVQSISRSVFSAHIKPEPGMTLALNLDNNGNKEQVPATVISTNKDNVILDYNHPLAGKKLTYTVTLLQIISN